MSVQENAIVTRWNFETGGSAQNIDEIYKKLMEQNRELKKTAVISAELDKRSGKLDATTQKLTGSIKKQTFASKALAHASGILLAGAFNKAWQGMKNVIKAGIEWEGTVKGVEVQVTKLREATDGMIGDFALARLAEYQKQLKLSDRETQAVAKAAVEYGRINKVTFDEGMQKVTDIVGSLTVEGMRKLGIQIDLVGTAAEKKAKIIKILTERYADMNIKASNAGERSAKLGNAWDRLQQSLGRLLLDALKLDKAFVGIAKGIDIAVAAVGRFYDAVGEYQRDDLQKQIQGQFEIVKKLRDRIKYYDRIALVEGRVRRGTEQDLRLEEQKLEVLRKQREVIIGIAITKATGGAPRIRSARSVGPLEGFGIEGDESGQFVSKTKIEKAKPGKDTSMEDAGRAAWGKAQNTLMLLEKETKKFTPALVELNEEVSKLKKGLTDVDHAGRLLERGMSAGNSEYLVAISRTEQLTEAQKKAADAQAKLGKKVKETHNGMAGFAVNTLIEFAGALWSTADAALQAGESFGTAMAQMVKATLLSIAQIATVEALKNVAAALGMQGMTMGFPNGGSVNHWASAAAWGGVAVAAGGTALGISAATRGGRSGAGAGASRMGDSTGRPSFGQRKEREQKNIIVNLYLDPNDPSSQLIAGRKITAMTKAALAA